jgi:hypothetical protein
MCGVQGDIRSQALGGVNLTYSWYRIRGQPPSTRDQVHTHHTDPHTHRLDCFLKFPELSGQVGSSRIPSKNADRKITNLSGKHSFTHSVS